MADTPWGQTAEMQWTKCLYLKDMAAADPDYQKRCIICREKVFHVEDDIPRMKGHIYSSAGMSEFWHHSNVRILFRRLCRSIRRRNGKPG